MSNIIGKNADGYGYKYTDISEIHKWLENEGFKYRQEIEVIDGNDYIVTIPIKVDTGEEFPPRRGCRIVNASLNGKSNPAQEQGAAITYARRYSLLMAFGLATADDDANCLTVPIEEQKISSTKVRSIITKSKADNVDVTDVLKKMNVKELSDLTEKQYAWVCNNWTKEFLNGDKGKN